MRALYYGIALVLLLLICDAASSADLSKMRSQALEMTGQLNGDCSATLIHSARDEKSGDVLTVFLTAKHCVDGQRRHLHFIDMPVYQNGRVVKRDRYTARVYSQHWKYDLALVSLLDQQTHFPRTAKITRSTDVPDIGSPVITVGYPLGEQLTVTQGLFGSLEYIDYPSPATEYYRATPAIVGGNSGGAMYLVNENGDYELIGVSSAGHRIYSHIGFYVPTYAIHEYLKSVLPDAVR